MTWVWIGLGASVFVRAIALFNFWNFARDRAKALCDPALRSTTPPLPPAYGFHFFFLGALIAFLGTPMEWLRLLHPTVLVLQTGFVSCYLTWVHRGLRLNPGLQK